MNVRLDDIANLCAIYAELGTKRITETELKKFMHKSMLIDNTCCLTEVLTEAISCYLIKPSGKSYILTDKGFGLARSQKQVSINISDRAKEFMLKQVYLSVDSLGADCAEFLLHFRADVVYETFVFHRTEQESNEENQWLKTLSRLGLLEVDVGLAKVRSKYLGLVNKLLWQVRKGDISDSLEPTNERNKVGDIAEEYAVRYERQRLSSLGQDDLCPLVQCISLIDRYAGYDVISFRGTGRQPEDEIYIEVKGTRSSEVKFIWSYNERQVAHLEKKKYWIYVFTNVDTQEETAKGPIRINNPANTLEKKGYDLEALAVRVSCCR